MDNLLLIAGILIAGMVFGSYLTVKWLAFITRKRRHAREKALRDIASHKWGVGDQNDAVTITRMALKGLEEQ